MTCEMIKSLSRLASSAFNPSMVVAKKEKVTKRESKVYGRLVMLLLMGNLSSFQMNLILLRRHISTYKCERRNSSRRTEHQLFLDKKFYGTHCELYRNFLVSDCNAAFDGKSLQFPDESHLTQKTYLSYKEQREIAATTFGMTVKEYEDFRNRTIVDRCKVLLRNLGEWARDFWS